MKILKSAPATTTGMIRHRWRKAEVQAHQHAGESVTVGGLKMWESIPVYENLAVRQGNGEWRVLQYCVMGNPDNVAAGWAEPAWSDWMDVPVED